MPRKPKHPKNETLDTKLRRIARTEALALGHSFRTWDEKGNGVWTARCVHCYRIATVAPALLPRDGRGRGGKALNEGCTSEEGNGNV